MAYCTAQDMLERFGERELRDCAELSEEDAIDGAVIQTAIADASAEMDAHLGRRYRVPIARRTPLLVLLACQIARYRLLDGREHEQAVRRYEEAITLLKALAEGKLTLGLPADELVDAPLTAGAAAVQSEPHPFNAEVKAAFEGRLLR